MFFPKLSGAGIAHRCCSGTGSGVSRAAVILRGAINGSIVLLKGTYTCILVLLCGLIHAQLLNNPVRQLGVRDGLPQGSVNSLFQSSEGFLWMGTGDGLARWDGLHFLSFRGSYNDTSGRSLSARMLRGPMAEDAWGRIWFTSNTGLSCYLTRSRLFRHVPIPSQSLEALQIHGVAPHNKLVLGDGEQIWILGLSGNDTGHWPLSTMPSIDANLIVLVKNTLYYESADGLYSRMIPGRKATTLLKGRNVNKILTDGQGQVIAWTPDQVFVFRDERLIEAKTLPANIRAIQFIPYLYAGAAGWYGMSKAGFTLANIQSGRYQYLPVGGLPARSLNSAMVLCMLKDRTGNIWVGTEGSGINIVDTKGFKFHTCLMPPQVKGAQPQMMLKSLLEVGGKLWMGSFNSGLFILDRKNGALENRHPFPGNNGRISLLFRDSSRRIWMNVEERIGYVDTQSLRFRQWERIPDDAVGNVAALSICEYRRDHYLLGSIHGLHLMSLERGAIHIRQFARRFDATQGQVTALKQMEDGSFFMGKVRDGFYRFRIYPEQDSIQILDAGFHRTGIREIQMLPGGTYAAMATENGLLFYQTQTRQYVFVDEKNGLSNSHIYGFLHTGDSLFWMSTNRGLNELRVTWNASGPKVKSILTYTAEDGLQSNEFNTGAFLQCADGALTFGGVMGLNWFYPGQLHKNPFPPQVLLTGIRVNEQQWLRDTDVCYLKSLSLPYDSNTITFSFAALDFTNPSANRYQYKLLGFDAGWVSAGEGHEARYANLPPGHYQFLINASNNDGVWNEKPLAFGLNIRAPWWQQVWARLVAILMIALLALFVMRLFLRRKLAKERRLLERQEAVNEERLRIARDMHDELGTGLTKIALLSEVARRKGSGQQPSSLKEIADASRELTHRIGEIVWTLNPQNDMLDTLVAYLREYLQEHFDAFEQPIFISDFPEDIPAIPLSHRLRQDVLLVIKEAVNNALKYAAASSIRVGMSLHISELIFWVQDDGRGFDPVLRKGSRQQGGNGLGNMKSRVESMNGHFSIETTPGEGTLIRFSVPRPTA